MPYPNEHSARLKDPKQFDPDSFRRTNGGTIYGHIDVPKTIGIIWGKLKGKSGPNDPVIPQALRFPTKYWTVAEAKKWLKDNDIKYLSFEPASQEKSDPIPQLERRYLSARVAPVGVEERAEGDRRIVGLAAVYYDGTPGTEYELWDNTVERIMPGAFDRVVRERQDVRALFNHDPNIILGRVSAGTLTLNADARGLAYEIVPADTQTTRDLMAHIERGDITGSSFSFVVADQGWRREGELTIREIKDVRVYDVGPVTFPAYDATTAGIRGVGDADEAIRAHNLWLKACRERERSARAKLMRARVVEIENALPPSREE